MSTAITTMANALIEFILSLLKDPEVAAEFDEAPAAAMATRGLQNVSYDDLCSVLPVVYDSPQVAQRPEPAQIVATPRQSEPDIVRELRDVVNNNSYVTNNSTLVDQSVNQNIWAEGDVMQLFDNEAILATGEGSTAAGRDIIDDRSQDSSTTIIAGDDALVDNTVDVTTTEDSYNQTTGTTTTDNSTTTSTVGATTAAPEPAPAPAPAPEPAPAPDPIAEAASYEDQSATLPEPDPLDDLATDEEF